MVRKPQLGLLYPDNELLNFRRKQCFEYISSIHSDHEDFFVLEAEGFVWRRLNTCTWEIHQENKRKAGWGGQKKEKGELDKGVQRSCSCRWRQTESTSEPAALHQVPFKWMKSAPFWLKGELQADSHSSFLIALFYLHFTCSTITTLFQRVYDENLVYTKGFQIVQQFWDEKARISRIARILFLSVKKFATNWKY